MDEEQNVPVIKPNIEAKLSKEKRQVCRDMVSEINNFGINQRQLVYLIYLLSMNLENRDLMLGVAELIGKHREEVPVEDEQTKSGLVFPDES